MGSFPRAGRPPRPVRHYGRTLALEYLNVKVNIWWGGEFLEMRIANLKFEIGAKANIHGWTRSGTEEDGDDFRK